jgi:hypothetical protein
MSGPTTLLVIGIHREELAFGMAVAAGLDSARFDILTIKEGLSGSRPRQDQRFHYDTLHRALYLQLIQHVNDRHRLLIDLHTGLDPAGPCADIYSRDTAHLAACLIRDPAPDPPPRLIPLVRNGSGPSAETVIPREIWGNPRFLYLGLEIYLPEAGAGRAVDQAYARGLIEKVGQCR